MTAYHFSSAAPDGGDGSLERPFNDLAAAGDLKLGPSDAIALERGSAFRGQALHVHGGGALGAPVRIEPYGDEAAAAPRIDADGAGVWQEDYRAPIGGSPHLNRAPVSSALLLRDVPYVEVRGLEITNRRAPGEGPFNALDALCRTGVAVIAERGTVCHTVLEGLDVHDVEGNVYHKHLANAGIAVLAHLNPSADQRDPASVARGVARFDDVQVRGCTVRRTDRWGIAVGYTAYLNVIDNGERGEDGRWTNRFDYGDGTIDRATLRQYGATGVTVEGNVVEDAGGDGITVMYCDAPHVTRNVCRRAARHINVRDYTATSHDRVAAAIWPWRCKDALFDFNEAYGTLGAGEGNADGQAWDADYGDGTVYRRNVSGGNTGGTVMFCNEMAVGSLFEGNVAVGDLMGAIDIPRNPDATVRGNAFILRGGATPLREDRADGAAVIEGNAFINEGGEPLRPDWHPEGSRVSYHGNLYVGFATAPQDDGEPMAAPGR